MLHLIINPTAGKGYPLTLLSQIRAELEKRGVEYAIRETEYPGHATELARQAAATGANVAACGGDGTLCEALCGLMGSQSTLYVVPCGTGNDFIKAFYGLSRDPIRALCQQLDGQDVRVDCGRVNQGAFLNVAGAGFDVEVLTQFVRFKDRGKGLKPYLYAVAAALRHFKPLHCEVELDGEKSTRCLTILSIANWQYIGGGMRVARDAQIDDGLFDVILVRRVPRFVIALLFPFFITGSFVRLPICQHVRCREVVVRSKGMIVNVDGELHPMDEARFTLLPGVLRMRRPAVAKT